LDRIFLVESGLVEAFEEPGGAGWEIGGIGEEVVLDRRSTEI
jgi:hypothetical protein